MTNPVLSAEQLRVDLRENVAEILITKMDGTPRILRCTLSSKYLPEATNLNPTLRKPADDSNELVVVWDVDNNGWRSFHIKQVVSCQIIWG